MGFVIPYIKCLYIRLRPQNLNILGPGKILILSSYVCLLKVIGDLSDPNLTHLLCELTNQFGIENGQNLFINKIVMDKNPFQRVSFHKTLYAIKFVLYWRSCNLKWPKSVYK